MKLQILTCFLFSYGHPKYVTHNKYELQIDLPSVKAVKYSPAGLPSTSDIDPVSKRLKNCEDATGEKCVFCIQTIICLLSLMI
jgi:hypothetical protein